VQKEPGLCDLLLLTFSRLPSSPGPAFMEVLQLMTLNCEMWYALGFEIHVLSCAFAVGLGRRGHSTLMETRWAGLRKGSSWPY
jgi:hypothetical protein